MNIENLVSVGAVVLGFGLVGCGAAGDGSADGALTEAAPTAETAAEIEQLAEVQFATSEADLDSLRAANAGADRVGLTLGPSSELLAEIGDPSAKTYFIGSDRGIVVHFIGKVSAPNPLKALPRGLPAVEIFRRLAPAQAIPAALIATQARIDEELRNQPLREPAKELAQSPVQDSADEALTDALPSQAGVLRQAAVDDSACPAEEFSAFSCNNTSADIEYCRLRKTGTNAIREDDVDGVFAFACPYRGKITHLLRTRPWNTWKTVDEADLLPGWNDWMIDAGSALTDQDIESRIVNADGDGFHHAASFWD